MRGVLHELGLAIHAGHDGLDGPVRQQEAHRRRHGHSHGQVNNEHLREVLEQRYLGIHVHQHLQIRPVRNLPFGSSAASHGVVDAAVCVATCSHLVHAIQVADFERYVVEIGWIAGVKPLGAHRLAVGAAPQVDELRVRSHIRPAQDSNTAVGSTVGHRFLQPGARPLSLG